MSISITDHLRPYLRYLSDQYPYLRWPIGRLWNTYEEVQFGYSIWRNLRRHSDEVAPTDPFALLDFPLQQIKYHSPGGFDSIVSAGSIEAGDWDKDKTTPIEDRFRYQSFQRRFFDGADWPATELYQKKRDQIQSNQTTKFATVNALDRKCAEIDEMFEDIKLNGYRTQAEIAGSNGNFGSIAGDGGHGFIPRPSYLVRHEVAIDIARDGEPLLNEGRHRMCMAKLLDLDHIPARIVVRHREWQDLRNRITDFLRTRSFESREEAKTVIKTNIPSVNEVSMGIDHPDIFVILNEMWGK